ncbi:response regulator transcription factor [Microbacterium sp. OR16]|uniref:response regulator transcription factor n=1 Tax=Microbacterium sp. OR16 TaxID=3095345 RepID=UPI0039B559E9
MTDSESNTTIVGGAPELARLLVQASRDLGFTPVQLPPTEESVALIHQSTPDLVVVVGDEPGADVLEMTRRIRAVSTAPLVILSVLIDPADVLRGFDAGADDYITLPIGSGELNARFAALVRRSALRPSGTRAAPAGAAATAELQRDSREPVRDPSAVLGGTISTSGERWLRHDGLALNLDSRAVLVEQREVELTGSEFALLATLLQSRRRVRNRSDLALVLRGDPREQWYEVSDAEKGHVDRCIGELRRKLGDAPDGSRYIEGSAETGYRLAGDEGRAAAPDASSGR